MRYNEYVGKLCYRVIGKYPEKKLQPIGMCIERKGMPTHPYMWCEFTPSKLNDLVTIPIDTEETHNAAIQTQPCTREEIEDIIANLLYEEGATTLPLSKVEQSTEIGYYFDIKQY